MIKNQRQYDATRARVAAFERALAELDPDDARVHPLLRKAKRDALQGQIDQLRSEVLEYDALQSGETRVIELTGLADLPNALIRGRIAARLSQRDLAAKLGLKEQQIQRYEATGYAGASLDRIREIADALGLVVREEVYLPSADISWKALLSGLRRLGIEPTWAKRILPNAVFVEEPADGTSFVTPVMAAAELLGRIFQFRPADLFSGRADRLVFAGAGGVHFKLPATVSEERVTAYTVYAHYLALLVLNATESTASADLIPTDSEAMATAIRERYGQISFRAVLLYAWDLGIAVVPLQGPGGFHGACWRHGGRNVVVLKQSTRSDARWTFDLLHELRHAAERPDESEFTVIESGEEAVAARESEEEARASLFAGAVALEGRAEVLVKRVMEATGGNIPSFSIAVPSVAKAAGVSTGLLANYLAFRLSLQGENWWGAAQNLQEQSEDPWLIARDELLRRVDFVRLAVPDRELLIKALATVED